MKVTGIKLAGRCVQFCWFWGLPLFHLWPFPYNYKRMNTIPIWRLAIGWVEIRIFPKGI